MRARHICAKFSAGLCGPCGAVGRSRREQSMSIFRKKEQLQKAAAKQGIALFFVKYLGSIPVSESKGSEVVSDALRRVSAADIALSSPED